MAIPLAVVTLLAFVYSLEQGIIVPLYVIKAQPIPMVSDMLKSALKKLAVYGCFLLKIIIFVALNIKCGKRSVCFLLDEF